MATRADFRAQREALGLAQQDVATALGVNIKTVKNWEKPGFQMPPDFAWDYLLEMKHRQDEMVWHNVAKVREIAEAADGRMPKVVSISYFRTQSQYDECGRDEGPFGFANAASRLAAEKLRRDGFYVEMRYPDDGAIPAKGSRY